MDSYYFNHLPINCINVITSRPPKGNIDRDHPQHRSMFFFYFKEYYSLLCYKSSFKILDKGTSPGIFLQNYTYPADTETEVTRQSCVRVIL